MLFEDNNEIEYINKLDGEYEDFNARFDELVSDNDTSYNRELNSVSNKLQKDGSLAQDISRKIYKEREDFDKTYNSLSKNEKTDIAIQNTKAVNNFAKATKQTTVFIDTKKGGDNNG